MIRIVACVLSIPAFAMSPRATGQVPGHAPTIGQQAPAPCAVVRNQTSTRYEEAYVTGGCSGSTANNEECLYLYVPSIQAPCAPTVLWIHGGGWSLEYGKDAPFNDDLCEAIAANGMPVVNVNYFLSTYKPCPSTPTGTADWMRTVQDIKRVIDWIRRGDGDLVYDLPKKIVVAGSSAGAHLAAMMATTDGGNTTFDPTGASYNVSLAVLYSPPLDFVSFGCDGIPDTSECDNCPETIWGDCNPCPSIPLYRGGPVDAGYPCVDTTSCMKSVFQEIFLGQRWDPLSPPLMLGGVSYDCTSSPPPATPTMPTGNPWFDASPFYWISGDEPDTYIFQSTCDGYVPPSQGLAFEQRFDAANTTTCTVTTYPVTATTLDCTDLGCQHAAEGMGTPQAIANQIRNIIEDELY